MNLLKTNPIKKTKMENIKRNSASKYDIASEELKKRTGAYPIIPVAMTPMEVDKVPNLIGGNDRKRRHGASLTLAVITDFQAQPEPITLSNNIPGILFDADNLKDLEERLIAQVQSIMAMAKDHMEGNLDLEDLGIEDGSEDSLQENPV